MVMPAVLPEPASSATSIGSMAIARRMSSSARCRRDLTVPIGMPRVAATSVSGMPEVVVQDDDGAALLVEPAEDRVDLVAIGEAPDMSATAGAWIGRELHLDGPPSTTACLVDAGVDGQSMEPGVESVGIAKLREIPPRPDEAFLDRVACELRVPEDEAGGLVQPHDGRAGELGEGVMIASPRPFHEPSLVHGRPCVRSAPSRRRLLPRYGVAVARTVLDSPGRAGRGVDQAAPAPRRAATSPGTSQMTGPSGSAPQISGRTAQHVHADDARAGRPSRRARRGSPPGTRTPPTTTTRAPAAAPRTAVPLTPGPARAGPGRGQVHGRRARTPSRGRRC